MRKAFGLLLALMLGVVFAASAAAPGEILVLGTWNVRGYPETTAVRSAWFASTLSTLHLDILCVQEIAN